MIPSVARSEGERILQSHCMVMGQGVGICAALALAAGVELAAVDIRRLQAQLRRDGAYLEQVPAS